MNDQLKVGQRWVLSINGSYRLQERTVEAIEAEAIKLGDDWLMRQAVKFVKLLADAPAESQPETKPQLYPFNLEAALAGAKLATRDGQEVSGFALRSGDFSGRGSDPRIYPYSYKTRDGRERTCTPQGALYDCGWSPVDLFLAEPWPRQEAKPAPKLGDGWPWVPGFDDWCYSAMSAGGADSYRWHAVIGGQARAERFNVYRTEAEAEARAELDKRLAIHAALRQLGGGDEGEWVVRANGGGDKWAAILTAGFAPGEARFQTKAAAQAALDVLLSKGILKHGVPL